jgi:hypothetical protein
MWFPEPRRCPIDDCPHTTCTSADYDTTAPIVIPQMPMRDAMVAAPDPADLARAVGATVAGAAAAFTTKTYRRRRDGR